MDGRCESCKWWTPYDGQDHICVLLSEMDDPDVQMSADEMDARDLVQIGGSPIYTPVLITRAAFGCNQWQAKERC